MKWPILVPCLVVAALGIAVSGCDDRPYGRAPASHSTVLQQAIVAAVAKGDTKVVVPQEAEWFVLAPPYGVTEQWVSQHLKVDRKSSSNLIAGSNGEENALIASGKGEQLIAMEWLPMEYTVSKAMIVYPGEILNIQNRQGPRRLVITKETR